MYTFPLERRNFQKINTLIQPAGKQIDTLAHNTGIALIKQTKNES